MANKKVKDKFPGKLLPISALMLAGSLSSGYVTAQTAEQSLDTVKVTEKAEAPEGKDSYRATQTNIGKGTQQLRDIPQSVTVVTEKLIDDRNLDTFKEALKNTAGISFLSAETGEEDIRLRGFSLQGTGDIFIDGMRDPAFYDRDTFNLDRLEVLRGSASMLFGRGSTGGAVNQVSKVPRLIDEHQVDFTIGSHNYKRTLGDFNLQTSDSSAIRMNVMHNTADNNGAGSSIDKKGSAIAYRWGIGEKDEFQVSHFYLDNNNGINYGMPWVRTAPVDGAPYTTLNLDPTTYLGATSDYNKNTANMFTLSHQHRIDDVSNLKSQIRHGKFTRDVRASAIRICEQTLKSSVSNGVRTYGTGYNNYQQCPSEFSTYAGNISPDTKITLDGKNRNQEVEATYAQSDFSTKFIAFGKKHDLLTGIDIAKEKKDTFTVGSLASDKNKTAGGTSSQINTNTTRTYISNLGNTSGYGWWDESARSLTLSGQYESTGLGIFAQDTISLTEYWKIIGGLRYDYLDGDYRTSSSSYKMKINEWSKRGGIMFQPNELHSYHFSAATSFNTSADAYSLSSTTQNTLPEKTLNLELGAKIDSADKKFNTRYAIFHTVKYNERNTDPDSAENAAVLSGQRHVSGFEFDFSGELIKNLETYGSFMWMPYAKVDKAAPCPPTSTGNCSQSTAGERPGDRPYLTPIYSGSIWNTYKFDPQWRAGLGINFKGRQWANRQSAQAMSYKTADVMAEYKYDKDVTIKANISNITNKIYADQLYSSFYVPGMGRLYQLTTSIKF